MKKKIVSILVVICFGLLSRAQTLNSFTATIQTKDATSNNYLSIATKKTYTLDQAKLNRSVIDLALIISKSTGKQKKAEWYNMSGKDSVVAREMKGTATMINGISFDKDQFDKCKTSQDIRRMTGYLTINSFSHFASIGDDIEKTITYHCFVIQMENGKRALLWIDAVDGTSFKITVKAEA